MAPSKQLGGSRGGSLLTLVMCVTCVIVGYILGSTRSNAMSLVGNMGGQASQTEVKVSQIHTMASNTTIPQAISTSTGSWHDVVKEIIPENLLPSYAPDKLLFPISRSMLRQSRPIVGNTERLHAYLKKLRSGTCTFVLFIGGSVTAGHNGGGPTNAYPKHFMDWVNEHYPCKLPNGTGGRHEYTKTHAGESRSNFLFWSGVTSVEKFDLAVLEFNVGDAFQDVLPQALEDKGEAGKTKEYIGSWYFEAVVRRLLLMRKPDPIAIVTFNADYMGLIWSQLQAANARKVLFRSDVEPQNLFVSSMYGIPVFSAVIWMLPLASKRGTEMQNNRTTYTYSTPNWHSDSCCHPRRQGGHHILSLVLAYCMLEEEKTMLSHNEFDTLEAERDFTLDEPPLLRDPLYLSPEEDEMYIRNSNTFSGVDFADPNGEAKWKDAIVINEGWRWYADNKDNDKFGFIANGTEGGQHIAISLNGEHYGKVEVVFVVSYENFGIALAWFGDGNVDEETNCNEEAKKHQTHRLVARWEFQASLPKNEILKESLPKDQKKMLHICLTPPDKHHKGPDNKFKLLGVKVF